VHAGTRAKHRLIAARAVWRGTVKVGNFDHLMTFKIVLKIFPNSF